ncbi:MAG TPA: phosphopantetheine-binding protein [Actinophytocola sp.]|jgi:acyl carrier protein|uniref:phosphopantetheine-binding protein n=1 Tax=Actinophytocola sp. TaxID=1872138 RepID=UPI002DFA7AEF|nr:phosphopantetheine-binding protein [Actinophytocola sp.]
MDKVLDAELRQRVVASIGTLLPQVLKRDLSAIPEDIRLFDELGLSSSKTLELLLALEEELGIEVDVDEIDRGDLVSIGAFADFVTQHATPL